MAVKQTDPMERLKRMIDAHGSQSQTARAIGVSRGYLHDVLHGKRAMSDKMLRRLGLRRITTTTIIEAQP